MATFKDAKEREWTLALDPPLLKRVHSVTGVMLTDLRADPMSRLAVNPILLCDVLYLLCEKQCKERDISDIEFGESLVGGNTIDEAVTALEVAVADTLPSSKRSLLKSLQQKGQQMQEKAMERAMAQMDSPEIMEAMERQMRAEMLKALEPTDSESVEVEESAT